MKKETDKIKPIHRHTETECVRRESMKEGVKQLHTPNVKNYI